MIDIKEIKSILLEHMGKNFRIVPKRPGILQIYAPFYHEDGDMFDIYLTQVDNTFELHDFGKTLMKLSYTFDIDSDNKRRILFELLDQNQVQFNEEAGDIHLSFERDALFPMLMHFAQLLAKVSRLDVLRRENVSSLFYELVEEHVTKNLLDFNPSSRVVVYSSRDDLEVPYLFDIKPYPVFLFPVRGVGSSRLAAISFLEFQKAGIRFTGCVVHENMEELPSKDRRRLTSAADKQFPSFDDFRVNAKGFLARESSFSVN